MRLSLIVLSCILIAAVHSAAVPPKQSGITAGRNRTSTGSKGSAYAYLRRVRGKNSCSSGSCPFWERHGRSFVSLRCYSQEYQECTCLHRMCYRSCLFSQDVCNQEMVHCLQQICRRCMPASASAVCAAQDAMAVNVANALSTFSCYSCCPPAAVPAAANTSNVVMSTTPMAADAAVTADEAAVVEETTVGTIASGPVSTLIVNEANPLSTTPVASAANVEAVPSRNQRVRVTVKTTKGPGAARRPARATTSKPKPNKDTRRKTTSSIKKVTTSKNAVKKPQGITARPKN